MKQTVMLLSAATSFGSIAGDSLPQKKKPNLTPSSSSSSSSSLLQLPNEITLNILARIPRQFYPSISLVSKSLNHLVNSPEIHTERSVINHTEHVLHVVLRSHANETPLWFTLNPKPFQIENSHRSVPIPSIGNGNSHRSVPIPSIGNRNGGDSHRSVPIPSIGNSDGLVTTPAIGNGNSHRLVPIPSFPPIPCWGMSIIETKSAIYILGGCVNEKLVTTAFVIESGSYTCRLLPNMKQPRGCAAAGIINGKLYVIGGCNRKSPNWIESFDLETQIWETVNCNVSTNVGIYEKTIRSFVMDEKIYIMDRKNSFVFDPNTVTLENDHLIDKQWSVGSCVIDDRLYSFGNKNKIFVFDPISRNWSRVKGLKELPDKYDGSRMANRGGKLVVLFDVMKFSTEIWCTEIELERRGGGEIWGKVLWTSLVLTMEDTYNIVRSLSVSV